MSTTLSTSTTNRTRVVTLALVAALSALAGVSLTACNTVKGVGRDVQSVGQAGQDAIDNSSKK